MSAVWSFLVCVDTCIKQTEVLSRSEEHTRLFSPIRTWTIQTMFWDASSRRCPAELWCVLGFPPFKQGVLRARPCLEIMFQWCLVGLPGPGGLGWHLLVGFRASWMWGVFLAERFVWFGRSKELPSNRWDIFVAIPVMSWIVAFVGWFKV